VARIVFGTGTVVARQAHAHLGHGGSFESCGRCRQTTWTPGRSVGVRIHAAGGRLVEDSALVRRLLAI